MEENETPTDKFDGWARQAGEEKPAVKISIVKIPFDTLRAWLNGIIRRIKE